MATCRVMSPRDATCQEDPPVRVWPPAVRGVPRDHGERGPGDVSHLPGGHRGQGHRHGAVSTLSVHVVMIDISNIFTCDLSVYLLSTLDNR